MRTSIPQGRQRLAALMRETGDVITIDDAVRVFDEDRETAAKLLSRWTQQGWLRRVGPGAYVGASLETLENEHVLEDLWVLVPALFEPGYVGGRTAAQHWDLTEQIFNDVYVMTTRPVREKLQRLHGANFTLKHIDPAWDGPVGRQARDYGTGPIPDKATIRHAVERARGWSHGRRA